MPLLPSLQRAACFCVRADKSVTQIPIPKCQSWQVPRPPSQHPLGVQCWPSWSFTLPCLQGAGHEHAWIWGLSLVTCCQCPLKVQSGISWSGCSISTCTASKGCHMGGKPQAMVRAVCVVQLHQPSCHLPVSSSSFTFSLPDVPASKTNLELLCSQNPWDKAIILWDKAIILFVFLVFKAGHQQWWLDRWCTRPPQCSFAAQEFPKQLSPFSSFLYQSFFLTQLQRWRNQVCPVDVQSNFCLLLPLSLQCWWCL